MSRCYQSDHNDHVPLATFFINWPVVAMTKPKKAPATTWKRYQEIDVEFSSVENDSYLQITNYMWILCILKVDFCCSWLNNMYDIICPSNLYYVCIFPNKRVQTLTGSLIYMLYHNKICFVKPEEEYDQLVHAKAWYLKEDDLLEVHIQFDSAPGIQNSSLKLTCISSLICLYIETYLTRNSKANRKKSDIITWIS